MIGYIYKITNISGKIYIGKTIDPKIRESKYKYLNCKSQTRLYRSLLKYGWDNHTFEIIEECHIDKLSEKEIFYINLFDSFKRGLNCTQGGEGCSGRLASEESKKKMSNSHKGKKQSKETIEKRVLQLKGKKRSQEFKDRLRKAHTGKKLSQETKDKLSIINKGIPSANRIKSKLINIETGEIWEANSLLELSTKCDLSIATLGRIKRGLKTKNTKKYIVK